MPVCNLLGNIYSKVYRSILGIIMMSNDSRFCFIVVPDKNIMVCCSQYNFSYFMAAILNFMFYKKSKLHIRPDITIGEPAKHNQNRKKSAQTMLAAVSLRYPVVFAYICMIIYFKIFFSNNKSNIWLSHT